jgi:ketosteroid isomerase-like protein
MAKAKGSRKKSARSAKSARRAPARTATKKAAAKRAAPSLESLAKKIVRLSQAPHFGPEQIRALYHSDAVSVEASGQTATGYAGLEEKMKGWEQMAASMDAKARNVWTGRNTICIEWDSTVTMHDGRTVQLQEVAVHEIEGGKIRRERYYYDPSALAPPPQGASGA